jgi:iron complex transport system substrate-binding protein
MGSGTIKDVYIAGRNTYYNELINAAGAVNAYGQKNLAYPMLSAEGVLSINPDIIIDLVPELDIKELTREAVKAEWQSVRAAGAVKDDRIYLLTGDYTVIPGPRFILLLEDLAKVIHPEIFRDL